MKKCLSLILVCIFITSVIFILNITVTSQQCIDFQCHTISLPLYLKILNFSNRHYNYKHLVKGIIKDTSIKEERVMKIFEWTFTNIKRLPPGFPVIDDHIWYTIIRGYGVNDQFSDMFSTLCNYAGIEAFFSNVNSKDGKRKFPLSFVKIEGKWFVFDPYNGIYFKDKDDRLCNIETIGSNNCRQVDLEGNLRFDIDYTIYFDNIRAAVGNAGLSRANIQSPLNRLFYEINKLMKNQPVKRD